MERVVHTKGDEMAEKEKTQVTYPFGSLHALADDLRKTGKKVQGVGVVLKNIEWYVLNEEIDRQKLAGWISAAAAELQEVYNA